MPLSGHLAAILDLTHSAMQGYEEVHVPAPKHKPFEKNERLIEISELPEWSQPAFPKMKSLNRCASWAAACAVV